MRFNVSASALSACFRRVARSLTPRRAQWAAGKRNATELWPTVENTGLSCRTDVFRSRERSLETYLEWLDARCTVAGSLICFIGAEKAIAEFDNIS
jgi:hypothetical protein